MTQARVAEGIRQVIVSLMDRVMNKVLVEDPFVKEVHHAKKPLYAALVPDEIFKGAHFERRFVTPFGSVWEELAKVVATEKHGHCEQGYTLDGTVKCERLQRIQSVLNKLEHRTGQKEKRTQPNWGAELAYILAGGGDPVPCSVTCDLFVENQATHETYAFELKAPLPNSDQTKVSKEKLFKLLAMEGAPVTKAFYALVYNPYGKREDYAWSFPMRWFDMRRDPSVLIGNELWNFLGGKGTYDVFIREINALGQEYRTRIYREFLGIEPPKEDTEALLR